MYRPDGGTGRRAGLKIAVCLLIILLILIACAIDIQKKNYKLLFAPLIALLKFVECYR